MREDGRPVALDMLVEPNAGASLGQHARKRGLADLKRIAPQVAAVHGVTTKGFRFLQSGPVRTALPVPDEGGGGAPTSC